MRKFAWRYALLAAWALLLLVGLALYLQYLQPARLNATVQNIMQENLPMDCSLGQVHFFLFPQPGISVEGVSMEQPGKMSFQAKRCKMELSWRSLIQFRPLVSKVKIIQPHLYLALSNTKSEQAHTLPTISQDLFSPQAPTGSANPKDMTPAMLASLSVEVLHGSLDLKIGKGQDEQRIMGQEINGTLRLPGLLSGLANLNALELFYINPTAPIVRLSNVSMNAEGITWHERMLSGKFQAHMGYNFSALAGERPQYQRFFPLPEPAELTFNSEVRLNFQKQHLSLNGLFATTGRVPMNGHPTVFDLHAPFALNLPLDSPAQTELSSDLAAETPLPELQLPSLALKFGPDSLVMKGNVRGLAAGKPTLEGRVDVPQFSLPYWFGFARTMPQGLQTALHTLSGFFDFSLNGKSLDVPRLDGKILGQRLTGYSHVKDFSKAVLFLQIEGKELQLAPIFPELFRKDPAPLDLPPPAMPLDNSTPPALDYDIRVLANTVMLADIKAEQAICVITPIVPWKNSGVLLRVDTPKIYGGKATSATEIRDNFTLRVNLDKVNIEGPIVALSGSASPLSGKMDAVVDARFAGNTAPEFISSLQAKLTSTIKQGKAGRSAFNSLDIQAEAKGPGNLSGFDMPAMVDFSGKWGLSIDSGKWKLGLNSTGSMTFGTHYWLPKHTGTLSSQLDILLKESFLSSQQSKSLNLKGQGQLTLDVDKGSFKLAKASLNGQELTVKADINTTDMYAEPEIKGQVSLASTNTRKFLQLLGITAPETRSPKAFQSFSLESPAQFGKGSFALSNIRGRLDQSNITGNVQLKLLDSKKQSMLLKGKLFADRVNISKYFPADSPDKPKGQSPLPLEFLQEHEIDLDINLGSMIVLSTTFSKVHVPVRLKKDILTIESFVGDFPGGGKIAGIFRANVTDPKTVHARLQGRITDVDMLTLTKNREQDTLISGVGNASVDAQGRLKYWQDIPGKLDGNWAFSIANGTIYDSKKGASTKNQGTALQLAQGNQQNPNNPQTNQQPSQQTKFDSLAASGTMLDGILNSKDFLLKGTGLTIKGSGDINLGKQNIDANVVATFLGVPEVPMHISGNLNDPKSTVQVMGAVAGTIGNIGLGLLDLVGQVLTAPFRILGSTGKPNLE